MPDLLIVAMLAVVALGGISLLVRRPWDKTLRDPEKTVDLVGLRHR
jgi:hypothetical protein